MSTKPQTSFTQSDHAEINDLAIAILDLLADKPICNGAMAIVHAAAELCLRAATTNNELDLSEAADLGSDLCDSINSKLSPDNVLGTVSACRYRNTLRQDRKAAAIVQSLVDVDSALEAYRRNHS